MITIIVWFDKVKKRKYLIFGLLIHIIITFIADFIMSLSSLNKTNACNQDKDNNR